MSSETPKTASEPERLFTAGWTLDHYQVIRIIGRGGMGEVYLARDTKLGRKVALKVIRKTALGDGAAAGRFVQEARVTARFNHPNIVTIYGVGEVEGSPYVALEYLEGQDLHERLAERVPSLAEAVRIARTIAEALAEAHRHDVLHRDLKPENVLMARDGRLRVLDFGLAKLVGKPDVSAHPAPPPTAEPPSLTQTGPNFYDTLVESRAEGIRGTPLYMSPEQWRGGTLTPATDIFSLGLILHELFTGRHPLTGLGFIDLCNRVLDPEPLPSVGAAGALPDTLVALVDRCLDKDAACRPTATELAIGLQTLVARDRPHSAQEDNPFRGLLPFTEQNADAYYGREAEVAAFLERLRVEPVLPVAGPSGAGKSSFVQAGVVPRLKERGRWMVIRMRPGSQPFHSLALRFTTRRGSDSAPFALLDDTQLLDSAPAGESPPPTPLRDSTLGADQAERLAAELRQNPTRLALRLSQLAEEEQGHVLLFVDQLEELYSLVPDVAVRRAFMQAICSAADDPEGPVRVIFTLRDDFLGRLAEGPEARQALGRITVLRSPEPAMLEEIVRQPVTARGYTFDDSELVPEMVAAVEGEAAALALLQFAGHRLWDARDRARRVLRRVAYDEMGGVAGALIQHLEQVLEGFSSREERVARAIFLRLVTPDSTRRVVARVTLLDGLGPDAETVLDRLTESRAVLVRKGRQESELELAHESLLTVWERFTHWLDESREERIFLAELGQAAALWEKRGRQQEDVWTGEALWEARRKAARCDALADPLARFLDAGVHLAGQQRKRRRFLYGLGLFALMAIAVAAVIVSVVVNEERRVAEHQKSQADRQRHAAKTQRDRAEAARSAALAESARAAVLRGALVEARAKIRGALEIQDSDLARALWWRLQRTPLLWKKQLSQGTAAARIAPDGRTVAVALLDGSIHLVDRTTLAERVLRGHEDQIFALTYGADSHTLISGDWSGRLLHWDLRRGTSHALVGHSRAIRDLDVQPGGHLLASGSSDKTVRLWDLRTGKQVRLLDPGTSYVARVRFSPDGRLLASGHHSREVKLWDVATGKLLRTLKSHIASVKALAFSPDGLHLASGANDRTILVWEVSTGKLTQRLIETNNVYGLRYSPDGTLLASAHADNHVRLWDGITGRLIRTLTGHQAAVYSVDFSRDGKLLASASTDRTVRLWRVRVARQTPAAEGHLTGVLTVVFDPKERFLASGGADHTIRLWDLATGAVQRVLRGHTKGVRALTMQPGGRYLASASHDQTVHLWNANGEYGGLGINTRMGRMQALDFSPDGSALAMGGHGTQVVVMDVKRRVVRHRFRGHTAQVNGLRYSPDGRLLVSAGADRTVRLWDAVTGRPVRTISGFADQLRGVVFTPDGRHLLVGSDDRRIYRIPVRYGPPRAIARFSGRTYGIDLHPDGRTLGVPCSDGSTWLLDLATLSRRRLRGHRDEVNALRFDRTGRRLATASDDGTVRLWATATGAPLWRGPLLSKSTLELFTHRGVEPLGPGGPSRPVTTRWREAVLKHARLAAEAPGGKHLCLYTHAGALELWDLAGDQRRWSRKVPGIARLLGLPKGCATLAGGLLRVHRSGVPVQTLAKNVVAMAATSQGLLAAQTSQMLRFKQEAIRQLPPLAAGHGITALGAVGEWIVLGYRDGAVELMHHRAGRERSTFSFEGVPASAVTRLAAGPQGTLLAGFADGTVGLWSLHNGTLLGRRRMHGAVNHLFHRAGRVYAATDLGGHLTLDLRLFDQPRCVLLRKIWQQVPVLWRDGLPERATPSPHHPCQLTAAP